jgi:parallel beta-helix repeat protein
LNYDRGLYISRSDENAIFNNNIISNANYGIYITDSKSNQIYNNNFINNTNQSFDDSLNNSWNLSYPTGGNYWSDYTGLDNFKGPNQDKLGSDGFGDTPYLIEGGSQDNYPLMEPFENYTRLFPGWNLMSTPYIQIDKQIPKVLEMIDGYYDAVQWYNVSDLDDLWKHYKMDKSFGNDLSQINERNGYWIHINSSHGALLLHNGTRPMENQSIQLQKGWNLVGYPSLRRSNRTYGLNNLAFGSDVDVIQWFNASSKTWYTMGPTDHFIPGRGYWIHSLVETTWEVPL